MTGWIKLHRSMLSWGWYQDVPTKVLWLHILLNVSRDRQIYQGNELSEGSFATTISRLSYETGLSEKQVRLALSKLEKTGEITTERTNKCTIINAVKWADYQGSDSDEGKQRETQRETPKAVTLLEQEEKKRRIYNKPPVSPFKAPSVEEVREYCRSRNNSIDPEVFVDFYTSKGWLVGRSKMKDWRAAIRTWERNSKGTIRTDTQDVDTLPTYDPTKNKKLSDSELDELLSLRRQK